MPANEAQIEYWNGPVTGRWLAHQQQIERVFRPFREALLRAAAAAPGERVIDVGCGAGSTLVPLAEAVGSSGSVLGVDVSAPFLARARERTRSMPNVRLLEADASRTTFEPGDLVCSHFGLMFFEDPLSAFAHLRSALVPGGRLAFVTWRALTENPWAVVPLEAVGTVLGPSAPRPPDAPGPFTFADDARVRAILDGAGFVELRVERFDASAQFVDRGVDEAVEYAMHAGPAARSIAEASEADRSRAIAALRRAFERYVQKGAVVLGGSAWIVTARRAP